MEPPGSHDVAEWLFSWKKYLAVEWIASRKRSYFTRMDLVRAYRDRPVEFNEGEASAVIGELENLGLLKRHDSKHPKAKWEFERLDSPWWKVIRFAAAARRQPVARSADQPRLEVQD